MGNLLKRLSFVLAAWASVLNCLGAAGDITGASTTNSVYWQPWYQNSAMLFLYVNGMQAGGTYNTGVRWTTNAAVGYTNADFSNAKVTVTITRQGFNQAKQAVTYTNTIYGTIPVRYPYPNQAVYSETNSGANVVLPIWLSDYIYAGDSNITVTVASGLYTKSGTPNNAASSLTVTNLSGEPYPQIVGHWTWPDHQLATNSWTNRFIGFQKFGFSNAPVAYAEVVATDAHGHSETNVATLVRDTTLTVSNAIQEFQTIHSAANFTQGDVVTNNFRLYPWIGTNSFCTTNSTVQSASLDFRPHYVLDDQNNSLTTVAVITTGGSDVTGRATNMANIATARANPFASIPRAVQAIRQSNNQTRSQNNASGGLILIQAGTYVAFPSYVGDTYTADTAWCVIQPDTGYTRADVILTSQPSLTGVADSDFIKFDGVTLKQATDDIWFYINVASKNLWFNNCAMTAFTNGVNGNGIFYGAGQTYLTANWITNSGCTGPWFGKIMRGNYFYGLGSLSGANVCSVVGNVFGSITNNIGDLLDVGQDNFIFAYNTAYRANRKVIQLDPHIGAAVVQNVIERFGDSVQPLFSIADGDQACTNSLLIANTIAGNRGNIYYYSTGASPAWMDTICQQDNVLDWQATKSDTFIGNSNSYGNWAPFNGVGFSGNCIGRWVANSFPLDELGGYSMVIGADGAQAYVNDLSGLGANTGFGNYRLTAQSPASTIRHQWNGLPYDLDGNIMNASSPPGAYAFPPTPGDNNWTNLFNLSVYGPGTNIYLWGTFTNSLWITNSGTPEKPITFTFMPDAKMSAPTLASPAYYWIYVGGMSNIVIDGGLNGLIQFTDNGTPVIAGGTHAYTNCGFTGIMGNQSDPVSHITIQNLTISNLYDRQNITNDIPPANGENSGISLYGSFVTISNVTITGCQSGIIHNYTTTPSSDWLITGCSLSNYNWGICFSYGVAAGAPIFYNVTVTHNRFTSGDAFETPIGQEYGLHRNGLIMFNESTDKTGYISNLVFAFNYIKHGTNPKSLAAGTAAVFSDFYNNQMLVKARLYNNISLLAYPLTWQGGNGAITALGTDVLVANNTVIGWPTNSVYGGSQASVGGTNGSLLNNIIISGLGTELVTYAATSARANNTTSYSNMLSGLWSDYNVLNKQSTPAFQLFISPTDGGWTYNNSAINALADWRAMFGGGVDFSAHTDPHSTTATVTLDSNYTPVAGDTVATGKGTNLSAFFTTDYYGNPRPAVGGWTIGAVEGAGPITITPTISISGQGSLTGSGRIGN